MELHAEAGPSSPRDLRESHVSLSDTTSSSAVPDSHAYGETQSRPKNDLTPANDQTPRRFSISSATSQSTATPRRPSSTSRGSYSGARASSDGRSSRRHVPRRSIAHGPAALGDASLLSYPDEGVGNLTESWDDVSLDLDNGTEQQKAGRGFLRFFGAGSRGGLPPTAETEGIQLEPYNDGSRWASLPPPPPPSSSSKSTQRVQEATRFTSSPSSVARIHSQREDDDDDEEHLLSFGLGPHEMANGSEKQSTDFRASLSDQADIEVLYGHADEDPFEGESAKDELGRRHNARPMAAAAAAAAYTYGDEDEDDQDDEEGSLRPTGASSSRYSRRKLLFEPLTRKEKISYWITFTVVLALSSVAIGIGLDWIGELAQDA